MKFVKICLSVGELGEEFLEMKAALEQYAQVDIVGLDGFSLEGYDIFIGKKLSESTIETADRLKAVFAYKTGVEDFPLSALKAKDIVLINSHADAKYIAEYAFGLSISLVNRIAECDKKMRKGIWYDTENPYWKSIFELKIGLLGYGHIGKEIHKILERNNIETYTINRGKQYDNINIVDTLEELCEKTALIIVSLPKTKETDLLFDEDMFKLLKNKYLVNVGRSNCIDEEALYKALKTESIAGAAIDTWDKKPKTKKEQLYPSKYPLTKLDNIVLSPHQAMRVDIGCKRYTVDITNKVIAYITHNVLEDLVNFDKGY